MITEKQVKEWFEEKDIELKEFEQYWWYGDQLDYFQTMISEFSLSFWIAELIVCQDEYETITYYRDKHIYIIGGWLPEFTIKDITNWFNEMETKSLEIMQGLHINSFNEEEEDIN